MMSASFGSFFWLSALFFYLKYSVSIPKYFSALFLILVMLFMYFINVGIMQTKCGSASGSVLQATLLPWLFMFGPMILALQFFPEWKNPFSNTIGFIVARMAGGTTALLSMLKPGSEIKLHYVYNDPSLLLNQFTPTNFDTVLESFSADMAYTDESKQALLKVVQLKDIVAEWIWYLLTASVVISTSYTMMMNGQCTKSADDYVLSHQVAMADTKDPAPAPTVYTITE
jgi:hypothetical protein